MRVSRFILMGESAYSCGFVYSVCPSHVVSISIVSCKGDFLAGAVGRALLHFPFGMALRA